MKNNIIFGIILVLLCFCVIVFLKKDDNTIITYADIKEIGLKIDIKNVTPKGATLTFNQYDENAPKGELMYGEEFFIQRKENDEWHVIDNLLDFAWKEVAYTISKNSVSEKDIDWYWLYGALTPGEYRIKKTIMDLFA